MITGRVYSKTKAAKRFGFVQSMDTKPQRRLLDVLHKQGMQDNQQITFLSDGADNVRDMQLLIFHPEAEHILDWFHMTMRITVLKQFAKGFANNYPAEGETFMEHVEKIKWNLWHGKTTRALEHLEDCYCMCLDDEGNCKNNNKKLLKHIDELTTYIENNSHIIPNYGDRWRYDEVIASSFVESTVNEVVTKRMVKKQQMQWSEKGAHYLLQARTTTLNDDLAKQFEQWYPGLMIEQQRPQKSVSALQKAA